MATKRNKRATREQQRDAQRWDQMIAQEEMDGSRYALLGGAVVLFGRNGSGPSDFMGSDGWFAWMTHHLRRHGRVFKTREEALFVLFGHGSCVDAQRGSGRSEEPSSS
jgi:hypothetical protein